MIGYSDGNFVDFQIYDSSGTLVHAETFQYIYPGNVVEWSTTVNLADGWYQWRVRGRFSDSAPPYYEVSDWSTAEFGVDTSPPSLDGNPSGTLGTNGWYISSVEFTISASDSLSGLKKIEYRVDNGSWVVYDQPFSVSDGQHQIEYKAIDKAGNQTSSTMAFKIDTVAPMALNIEINGGASSTNSTSVTLTLSANDDTSGVGEMQFSLDDSNWTDWEAYSTSKSFTLPSGDGEKTVYFRVRDKAGNLSSAISATIILETPKLPTPSLPPSPPSPSPAKTSAEIEEQQMTENEFVIEPIFELQLPNGPITNADGSIIVIVRISNPSDVAITKHCELRFNGSSIPIDLTVQPGENKEITITLDVPENLKGEFSVVLADDAGEELASGTLTLAGTAEPESPTAIPPPEGDPSVLLAVLALGTTGMTLAALKFVRGKSRRARRSLRPRKSAMTRPIKPPTESAAKPRKYDELMERTKIHKEYRENSVD
jgi:hypothetical protein